MEALKAGNTETVEEFTCFTEQVTLDALKNKQKYFSIREKPEQKKEFKYQAEEWA